MKLTREQISKLSDTELNRAMVWCYPDSKNYDGYYDEYMGYDYLTDYNLTMPLLFKLDASLFSCDGTVEVIQTDSPNHWSNRENPLRAICEVLVMIALEGE
jgi:hypothetical protein